MPKKDALQTAVYTVTNADANLGSEIPQNMYRFIYRIKTVNNFAGPNVLTLGKRENGAGATTNIDVFAAAVQYEQDADPGVLLEDSIPIHKIGGRGTTGASNLRGVCSAAGTFTVTVWYEDAESPT